MHAERTWEVKPVGFVQSPYIEKLGTPKQATILSLDGGRQEGKIQLYPGFEECINDLSGFDYIWVITFMHLNQGFKTKVFPRPLGATSEPANSVGLFSTRAPHRPNPIALSALKLIGNLMSKYVCSVVSSKLTITILLVDIDPALGLLYVDGLDLINDTPVLDIKPYIPAFDAFPTAKAGWMDNVNSDYLFARDNGYQGFRKL
jgi:tRNA-Thr(GGU) m(6)t(6)A37 methyltransferase TsaA